MCLQEGFEPSFFKSSRSERASIKQQSLDYFLDEDEKEEANKSSFQVKVCSFQSKWSCMHCMEDDGQQLLSDMRFGALFHACPWASATSLMPTLCFVEAIFVFFRLLRLLLNTSCANGAVI